MALFYVRQKLKLLVNQSQQHRKIMGGRGNDKNKKKKVI
jgi:hypothetical protein